MCWPYTGSDIGNGKPQFNFELQFKLYGPANALYLSETFDTRVRGLCFMGMWPPESTIYLVRDPTPIVSHTACYITTLVRDMDQNVFHRQDINPILKLQNVVLVNCS